MEADYRWEMSVTRFRELLQDIEGLDDVPEDVSPAVLSELLDRLEATGAFTPIEIYREYQDLTASLDAVIREPALERSLAGWVRGGHTSSQRVRRTSGQSSSAGPMMLSGRNTTSADCC